MSIGRDAVVTWVVEGGIVGAADHVFSNTYHVSLYYPTPCPDGSLVHVNTTTKVPPTKGALVSSSTVSDCVPS